MRSTGFKMGLGIVTRMGGDPLGAPSRRDRARLALARAPISGAYGPALVFFLGQRKELPKAKPVGEVDILITLQVL